MAAIRRIRAIFDGATPAAPEVEGEPAPCAVVLHFRPDRARLEVEQVDDHASLGPELDIPAVAGLGKVMRILRAARVSAGGDIESILGRRDHILELLARASGTMLVLELRPRSRVRFTAWTDAGVETVDDVNEVLEAPDAWLVTRQRGRFPIRVPRDAVIRQRTDCERWYEVLEIERA